MKVENLDRCISIIDYWTEKILKQLEDINKEIKEINDGLRKEIGNA